MQNKQQALARICLLMKEHSIKISEIKNQLALEGENKNVTKIRTFLALIGGILIFCGLSIFISEHWIEMNSFTRILSTLGTGVCLFILALVALNDVRYENILTPLFIIAALFETTGMFVTIDELFHSGANPRYAALVVFATMFIQQVIVFWQTRRTTLLLISLILGFSFLSTLFDLLHMKSDYIAIILGICLMYISYKLTHTKHESLIPLGYLIGSSAFLIAVFDLFQNKSFELLYLGISILIIYSSTILRSRMLLFTGTVSMIAYIGYFTDMHFVNSIGWPLALILFGFIMLGISAASINIGRSIKK